MMKAQWTEASAYKAINAWLRLSTSQQSHIDLIAAHNDAMVMGAENRSRKFPSKMRANVGWRCPTWDAMVSAAPDKRW